jgi:hypothetical protein
LAWSRRLADLVGDHISDLGGDDNLSTAELVLVKRASMINRQLEMLECKFAEQDGMATSAQLDDLPACGRSAGRVPKRKG